MRVERLSVSVVTCRFLVQKRSLNPEQDGPAFGLLSTSEMFWRELTTRLPKLGLRFCVRDAMLTWVMSSMTGQADSGGRDSRAPRAGQGRPTRAGN